MQQSAPQLRPDRLADDRLHPTSRRAALRPTLLVVGDDLTSLDPAMSAFRRDDFEVRTAPTAPLALDDDALVGVDVVIVDLDAGRIDGIQLCRRLRCCTKLPIIALSHEDTDDRKVAVLDLGADDYLAKSASIPELLARTRVAVRHSRALASLLDDELLQVGMLRIDLPSREAMLVNRSLELTAKEFTLLTLLARNAGKVVTHRVLLERVWGEDAGMDTLRTHVSHLRRKFLSCGGGVEIFAASGVGYRLDVGPA